MRLITPRLAAAAAASLLATGLLAMAGPASASGCSTGTGGSGTSSCDAPVSVSVTVASAAETLTLNTSTLNFGTVAPGASQTATESWSVSGNDTSGFSLTLQTTNPAGLQGSANSSDDIPNNDVSVANSQGSRAFPANTTGIGSFQDWSSSAPNAGPVTDTWTLEVPAAQAADTYSESFDYILVAN